MFQVSDQRVCADNGLSAANKDLMPKTHPCGKASMKRHAPQRATELKVVPVSKVHSASRIDAGICSQKRMMLSPQGGFPYRPSCRD